MASLKIALNTIWGVAPAPNRSWWWTVWDWARAMLLVLACGGLLVVSLVLTVLFSWLATYTPATIDGLLPRAQLINLAVSVIVMFLLFAMIFKWLPDVKTSWGDVWFGAAVTSLLFLLGKEVLGVYLGHVATVSPYGAGSSLAMLLLWAYYSSQILLLGGELVRAYARAAGSRVRAEERDGRGFAPRRLGIGPEGPAGRNPREIVPGSPAHDRPSCIVYRASIVYLIRSSRGAGPAKPSPA